MGKKSRLKRERRNENSDSLMNVLDQCDKNMHYDDIDYQRCSTQLRQFFKIYSALDVYTSLTVSELWLPNISSQVKHQFAIGIFISIPEVSFLNEKSIISYSDFFDFIQEVYSIIPNFPSVEDYVPEPDWGEICVSTKGKFRSVFYGGGVERIPDYIEAFRLINIGNIDALNHMEAVITIQDQFISQIPRGIVGDVVNACPGYIEPPSEVFWVACCTALLNTSASLSVNRLIIPKELQLDLGLLKDKASSTLFVEAVLTGDVLPVVLVRINERSYPLSIRNVSSVIIDFWGKKGDLLFPKADQYRSLADFLSMRLGGSQEVICGLLRFCNITEVLPYLFVSSFVVRNKFYFITLINAENLYQLPKIELDIKRLIVSGLPFGVRYEGTSAGVEFSGSGLKHQEYMPSIVIIAVLAQVTTQAMPLIIPNTNAEIMSLPDFVTIFDSLKNVDELDNFFSFVKNEKIGMHFMPVGIADHFASFRDAHGVLVDGADEPSLIHLDPHWGSNWRFEELVSFWSSAPRIFPGKSHAWNVEKELSGIYRLTARGEPALAYCALIKECHFYSTFSPAKQKIDELNFKVLELIVNCIADSAMLRKSQICSHFLFSRQQILITCLANEAFFAKNNNDGYLHDHKNEPLLSGWKLNSRPDSEFLKVSVEINLDRSLSQLSQATNASFEVELLLGVIEGISMLIGLKQSFDIESALRLTAIRRPRFVMKSIERAADVPDYPRPKTPTPEQYKIARRKLAFILKGQGVEPGRYELEVAKNIIGHARDELRVHVHKQIELLDRKSLIIFCIQQLDELTTAYEMALLRTKQSLTHEVSYNRYETLSEANENYLRDSRNYRYLLECCWSNSTEGTQLVTSEVAVQLIAFIDWLLVFYNASDVLHNDIDVGGLDVNDSFIPGVFFSEGRQEKEALFGSEKAKMKLGIELNSYDEVNSLQESDNNWIEINQAFIQDLGFSFLQLLQTLSILGKWQTYSGCDERSYVYHASFLNVNALLIEFIEGLSETEATKIINFIALDSKEIRILLGKVEEESDVPVWEHNKRGSRYTIKPLIVQNDVLSWGSYAAYNAFRIWYGAIFNGYLPADFNWPNVKKEVRNIKESIENKLEKQAFEVVSRCAPFCELGIDFKRKFPSERFEDVGDFDVLAYWPKTNQWLTVECKYNQQPFCLKDARRLRERIFGKGANRAQIAKIEGRRDFLNSHMDHLRILLGWPKPFNTADLPSVFETYVSRDIYWWMRNPPYELPTHFVRIDNLDNWLKEQGLFLTA